MENVIRYCGECYKYCGECYTIMWRMLYDNVENGIRCIGECYKILWRML